TDVLAADCGDLVDHDLAVVLQTGEIIGGDAYAKQRGIDERRRQGRHGHRGSALEEVVLHDQCGPRLGGVDTSGDGPQLAAPHSSSQRAVTASTNSWSSDCSSAIATR